MAYSAKVRKSDNAILGKGSSPGPHIPVADPDDLVTYVELTEEDYKRISGSYYFPMSLLPRYTWDAANTKVIENTDPRPVMWADKSSIDVDASTSTTTRVVLKVAQPGKEPIDANIDKTFNQVATVSWDNNTRIRATFVNGQSDLVVDRTIPGVTTINQCREFAFQGILTIEVRNDKIYIPKE